MLCAKIASKQARVCVVCAQTAGVVVFSVVAVNLASYSTALVNSSSYTLILPATTKATADTCNMLCIPCLTPCVDDQTSLFV